MYKSVWRVPKAGSLASGAWGHASPEIWKKNKNWCILRAILKIFLSVLKAHEWCGRQDG